MRHHHIHLYHIRCTAIHFHLDGSVQGTIGFAIASTRKKEDKEKSNKKASKPTKTKKNKVDYKSMKIAELKAELKKKGLKTSGKKAELIKRLE